MYPFNFPFISSLDTTVTNEILSNLSECLSETLFSPNERKQRFWKHPSSSHFLSDDMISEILTTTLGKLDKNMRMRLNKLRRAECTVKDEKSLDSCLYV